MNIDKCIADFKASPMSEADLQAACLAIDPKFVLDNGETARGTCADGFRFELDNGRQYDGFATARQKVLWFCLTHLREVA